MDKHTFIGKRKIGSTDICDFTDYQGIGRDPLYKRYDSVFSIVKKVISPEYIHFFAIPDYSSQEDTVNWYIDEWTDAPEVLTCLESEKKEQYQRIKEQTIAHYKKALNYLSGEELQVMACALRYIDDDFVFCCDGKVYVVAWGMTPDTRKHISKGELIHEAPTVNKFRLTFDFGEHGRPADMCGHRVSLPEGSTVTPDDVPRVATNEGFTFKGWDPEPIGWQVVSDMTFKAVYEAAPSVIIPEPPVIPEPQMVTCRFDAGANGSLHGPAEVSLPMGSRLMPASIPAVVAKKGFTFQGWDINPLQTFLQGDMTFHAVYKENIPWYKKLFGPGCLKWLLWILLALVLLFLLGWLLKDCHGCSRDEDNVEVIDPKITADGDTIYPNGAIEPIELRDGELPQEPFMTAPVVGEEGELPPIIRDEFVPPVLGNRLILFLENDNDNIDALADAFKKAYPGNQYSIIGFDRDVKSLTIQIPESEREEIRRSINSRIPNHQFIVFDEEIFELKGRQSAGATASPGWHLKAVNASQGWEITKGSPSVVVAVIDDGIDASHPMFKGRIVSPYNVFTQNNRLSHGTGHGTHTAGLAVGSLEFVNQGAAGIAPECKLMPVQVFDNGLCPLSALVSGVMYAVHKGADVVNISIAPTMQGLNALPFPVQEGIAREQFKNVERLWRRVCKIAARKNTILVFAAGNDDIISSIPPENRTDVAITVGAVDRNLYPTDFTNYGPCTDISAPGKDIYSSFPVKSFQMQDGTSMAAPIVSGAIALMKSLKKDLTVKQAWNVLYRTGRDVYGYMPPMVQINLALDAVKRGDFSEPEARTVRPVPEDVVKGADGRVPESWVDNPGVIGIIPGIDNVEVTPDGRGDNVYPGVRGDVVNPDGRGGVVDPNGRGDVVKPDTPGVAPTPPPAQETDYEAIRRLIEEYKRKIKDLESQLPENKKK